MTGPHSLLEDYFKLVLGDPEGDRDFLVERSPKTHIGDIACPLLTIQGRNHPRVLERESHDLLGELSGAGKEVDTSSSATRATRCSSSETTSAATTRSRRSSQSV
jgi:fermentation-respiration switch protein FrsA (DUF1100 family)